MSILSQFGPPLPPRIRQDLDRDPRIQDNAPLSMSELELEELGTCMFCSEPFAATDIFEWHRWGTLDGHRRHCYHVGHLVCPTLDNSGLSFVSQCPECNVVWDRLPADRTPEETVDEMRVRLERERYEEMRRDVALLISTDPDPQVAQQRRQLRQQMEITPEGDASAVLRGVPSRARGANTDLVYQLAAQKRRVYNNYAHSEGLELPFPNEPDPAIRNLMGDFEEEAGYRDADTIRQMETLFNNCIFCIDDVEFDEDNDDLISTFENNLGERAAFLAAHNIQNDPVVLSENEEIVDLLVTSRYVFSSGGAGYLMINALVKNVDAAELRRCRLANKLAHQIPTPMTRSVERKYDMAFSILKLLFEHGIFTTAFLRVDFHPVQYEELCLMLLPPRNTWYPGQLHHGQLPNLGQWRRMIRQLPPAYKIRIRNFLLSTYGIVPG
jgi:hypothetical protein